MEHLRKNAAQVASLLKQLANENRLLILCTLSEGSLNVSQLNQRLSSLGQSALSQHLAKLRESGLLRVEQMGASMVYSIADSRVLLLLEKLKELFC